MMCYLVRHGQDDSTVRGGWSSALLTAEGVSQVHALAASLLQNPNICPAVIHTSDLPRARQTAEILGNVLQLSVIENHLFREVNNGDLAGMKNEIANFRYPGLYWNTLGWDEHYPNGESPHEFFARIHCAWSALHKEIITTEQNAMLVTHGGVINAILYILNKLEYSNKRKPFPVSHASMTAMEISSPIKDNELWMNFTK